MRFHPHCGESQIRGDDERSPGRGVPHQSVREVAGSLSVDAERRGPATINWGDHHEVLRFSILYNSPPFPISGGLIQRYSRSNLNWLDAIGVTHFRRCSEFLHLSVSLEYTIGGCPWQERAGVFPGFSSPPFAANLALDDNDATHAPRRRIFSNSENYAADAFGLRCRKFVIDFL